MINGKEIAASLLELWLFLASCIFMIQCYDVIIDRAKMLNTSEEKKTNKKEYRQSALDFHLTHTEQTARRSSQEAFRRFFLNNTKLYAIFRLLRFIFFFGYFLPWRFAFALYIVRHSVHIYVPYHNRIVLYFWNVYMLWFFGSSSFSLDFLTRAFARESPWWKNPIFRHHFFFSLSVAFSPTIQLATTRSCCWLLVQCFFSSDSLRVLS